MNYGKLINSNLILASNPIQIDGKDIFTNDPTQYGFKEIVYTNPPSQKGYRPIHDGWEETNTQIIRKWKMEQYIESTNASNEEILAELIDEIYAKDYNRIFEEV